MEMKNSLRGTLRICTYEEKKISTLPATNQQQEQNFHSPPTLTFALVGIPRCCSRPRSIEEERFTFLAVASSRVVLAVAFHLSILVLYTT